MSVRNAIRTAVLGAVGVAVAAVVATAVSLSDQHVHTVSVAERRSSLSNRPAVAAEIPRLHRLPDPVAAPKRSRNPFAFGATAAAPAAKPALAGVASTPSSPEASDASRSGSPVVFTLIGIAEDARPGGTIRTAIISGSGELFLVKEGERVTERYRLSIVLPDAAVLSDVNDGATLRLVLREHVGSVP